MLARGLRVDARRGHGFAGQVAVGEFVEQRAADRARRALLARAVHRHEQADVGVGEQPQIGMEPFRIAPMRDSAMTVERSEERRVGEEGVRTGNTWGVPYNSKKK